MRWMRIGLAAAILLPVAWVSPAVLAADEAPLGERLVDVMNQLFGKHPGLRAMHAKGVVVEGSFTPEQRRRRAQQGRAVPGRPRRR